MTSSDNHGEKKAPARGARARRTQAERTEAMRALLSAEAYRLIAEGGVRALTIRSLAMAAGVSQGAVLHHFPDRNAIVLAAIEQALMLARDEAMEWLAKEGADGDAQGVLKAMLAEFRAFFFSDRFWVAIGITLEASKDDLLGPQVRTQVSALRKPLYAAWADRLIALGWTRESAERDVRAAAQMVSGAAIRRLWADADETTEIVEKEWVQSRLAGHTPPSSD